jgi:hypothetical protein
MPMTSIRNMRKKAKEDELKERMEQELKEDVPVQDELDFDESEFEIVADQRKGGKKVISINRNLGRVVLYKAVYEEMEKEWGSPFSNVLLMVVPRISGKFWIRPCADDADGGKKIHRTGETRMVSAKMLVNRLDLAEEAAQYSVKWDKKHNALMVDVSVPHKK